MLITDFQLTFLNIIPPSPTFMDIEDLFGIINNLLQDGSGDMKNFSSMRIHIPLGHALG
jgi:hypothetical protein